ncbi:MAG: 4-aminobutyrate--2-oxoglutarate transaminase [Pseudomonadota bacterium]
MDLGKETERLARLREARVPRGVANITPFYAASAKGAIITDVEGREFIDFAGGIGVMNVGHCHPKVVAAIKDQADKFIHTCFHVMAYAPYVELADRLCRLTPGDFPKKTMLANSGAEAVENAVKVAKHFTGRHGVIAFDCAFHGRTLVGMSLTSKVKPYKLGFGPFAPEVYRLPYAYCYRCPMGLKYPACGIACAAALDDFFVNHAAAESIACLIVEPIAGEGGFVTPPPEYFPMLAAICKKQGIVFISDEIQTGMARTGKYLAIEHWGVEPDIATLAKSLAAGMPLSAVVGRSEIMDSPMVGGLGGTYGGNPLACRAALAVLDLMEEERFLDKADVLGAKIRDRFESWMKKHQIIGEVRGKGPMLALELVRDRETKVPAGDEAKALVKYCYERGLITLSCGNHGNVIRILTPLVITDEQLEKGLAILEEGLASFKL